jgi:hypothetical protein
MPLQGERLSRAEDGTTLKLEGRNLPPRTIVKQEGWNSRDMSSPATRDHIENTLKPSIKARMNDGLPGLFDPIKVRYIRATGTPLLIDGECRLTAYLELWDEGIEANIPVIDTDGSAADLRVSTLVGNSGLPLTPLEIGLQCKRLRDGLCKSEDWIAEHIGKPRRFITDAIALHDAPEEAKALVAAGEVTPSAVLHAVKEHGADEGVKVLKAAVAARPTPPSPAQASIPGTAKPAKAPKPVARPKVLSKREQALQEPLAAPQAAVPAPVAKPESPNLKSLAIDLAYHVISDDLPFDQLERLAFRVYEAAGVKYVAKKVV